MADDNIRPGRPSRRRRDDDDEDDYDDRPRRRRSRSRDDDEEEDDRRIRRNDGGLNKIIPYKNPLALIGYYVSVFALLPFVGLILGPGAIVLGCLGLVARSKNPRAGGLAHAIVALVLGSVTAIFNVWLIFNLEKVGKWFG